MRAKQILHVDESVNDEPCIATNEGNLIIQKFNTEKEAEQTLNLWDAAPDLLEILHKVDHTITLHGKIDKHTELHLAIQHIIAGSIS